MVSFCIFTVQIKGFFLPPFLWLLVRGSHIDIGLVCSTESLTQQQVSIVTQGSIWWDINRWLWISWQRSLGISSQGYKFQRSRKLTIKHLSGQWVFETPEHLMDNHIANTCEEIMTIAPGLAPNLMWQLRGSVLIHGYGHDWRFNMWPRHARLPVLPLHMRACQ